MTTRFSFTMTPFRHFVSLALRWIASAVLRHHRSIFRAVFLELRALAMMCSAIKSGWRFYDTVVDSHGSILGTRFGRVRPGILTD